MKVKCGYCKEYISREGAVSGGLNYFCDSDCRQRKSFEAFQGAARTPRKMDVEPTAKNVFEKDGFQCRYCGGRSNLITHHVIYRSEIRNRPWKNEDSNLLTLCNEPCHLTVIHGNKKKYQPLCLKIVWLREVEGDKKTLIKDIE